MLNDIKLILGIASGNTTFDSIINTFINTGKQDLIQSGIISSKVVDTDPLIYSALVSFVLSMLDTYEYRELSANAYALQKDQLRHYVDYIEEGGSL